MKRYMPMLCTLLAACAAHAQYTQALHLASPQSVATQATESELSQGQSTQSLLSEAQSARAAQSRLSQIQSAQSQMSQAQPAPSQIYESQTSQTLPASLQSDQTQPASPRSPHPELNGHCNAVRPGDLVHFTLTIRSVEYARSVYADLQMHLGRSYIYDPSGLPPPDFQTLGGGGVATRDAHRGDVYHFAFTIPREVYSGIYHGSGVYVTAAENNFNNSVGSRSVAVTNHTLHKVRDYCLIVISPYGGLGQPLVTDFHGGPVERRAQASEPSSSRIYLPTR